MPSMTDERPRWAWLLFPHLSIIVAASILAACHRLPADFLGGGPDKLQELGPQAVRVFAPRRRGDFQDGSAAGIPLEARPAKQHSERRHGRGKLKVRAAAGEVLAAVTQRKGQQRAGPARRRLIPQLER